jgi:hypothetical protein
MSTQHTVDRNGLAKCTERRLVGSDCGSRIFDQAGRPTPRIGGSQSCPLCLELNRRYVRQHEDEKEPGPWIHRFVLVGPGSGIHISAEAATGFPAEETEKAEQLALGMVPAMAKVGLGGKGLAVLAGNLARGSLGVRPSADDALEKCKCGWPLPDAVLPIRVNDKTVQMMNVAAAIHGAAMPGPSDLEQHATPDAFVILRCPVCDEGHVFFSEPAAKRAGKLQRGGQG